VSSRVRVNGSPYLCFTSSSFTEADASVRVAVAGVFVVREVAVAGEVGGDETKKVELVLAKPSLHAEIGSTDRLFWSED